MKKIFQETEFLAGICLVAVAFVLLAFLVFFANNTPGKVLSILFGSIALVLFFLLLVLLGIKINQRRKKNARLKSNFQKLARAKRTKRRSGKRKKNSQRTFKQISPPDRPGASGAIPAKKQQGEKSGTTDLIVTSYWSLPLLKALDWRRFQLVCTKFYIYSGYRAEITPLGQDPGFDIKIYKKSYSETEPFALVRCVSWNRYQVGIRSLRELYGVMAAERTPYSIFMTSGEFTDDAKQFAKDRKLLLIDGSTLMMLIERLPRTRKENLLTVATKGDFSSPTCPRCGQKMILKKSSHGRKWICSTYPDCREHFFIPANAISPERRLR